MSEIPDFNLNYAGMFGMSDDEDNESDPVLPCVDEGEEDCDEPGPCDESLTAIEFDPLTW